MTNVKFYKNENKFFVKLKVFGHTGFSEHGTDILCAAISSIVQAGAIGLQKVLNLNVTVEKDDESGHFLLELPKEMSQDELEKSQIIFETIHESIKDLKKGYSKFIKLEVK